MTRYFDIENQEFNEKLWIRDQLNRSIYLKIMSKTKTCNQEALTLRKYFQYYDIYNCRYITFESFIKALNRMGILELNNVETKFKDYFDGISNGKKHLNYHHFCEEIRNSIYKNKLDAIYNTDSFSKQLEKYTANNYFYRPSNSPY